MNKKVNYKDPAMEKIKDTSSKETLRGHTAAKIYQEWGYPESYSGYTFKDVPSTVKDKARSIKLTDSIFSDIKEKLDKVTMPKFYGSAIEQMGTEVALMEMFVATIDAVKKEILEETHD